MPQYLLSVHGIAGEPQPSPETMQRMYAQVDTFNAELRASDSWVFAGGLYPVESSTVVRASGGDVVVTDGPFAETKEQLGGFWIIEAPDLDVALAVATKASAACESAVEVRPFQELPE